MPTYVRATYILLNILSTVQCRWWVASPCIFVSNRKFDMSRSNLESSLKMSVRRCLLEI